MLSNGRRICRCGRCTHVLSAECWWCRKRCVAFRTEGRRLAFVSSQREAEHRDANASARCTKLGLLAIASRHVYVVCVNVA